jgi:hypothetical protein
MSGWTVLTVRGKVASDYEYSRSESMDPWDATADIVATMDSDSRIKRWEVIDGHVHAYTMFDRYAFEAATSLLEDYQPMLRDAVVLGANDTSDTGEARYYNEKVNCTDIYRETQSEDGTHVGRMALAVINSRHGIIARDPFHEYVGQLNEMYLDDGVNRRGE